MAPTKRQESEIHLKVPSETTYLELIRTFVVKVARDAGFSDEDVNNIAIAVDEACTNVMKHSYKQRTDQKIDLVIKVDYQKLTIIIIDRGESFDPNQIPLPKLDEYIAELRVGGLGIYLMKTLMDEVDYEVEPTGQNRVKMVKYFVNEGHVQTVEN